MASMYRAIALGGDAYLPFESMIKKWNNQEYDIDDAAQREALAELKRAASKIVSSVVESSLSYGSKDELDYLTCIRIEDEDVPWNIQEDD